LCSCALVASIHALATLVHAIATPIQACLGYIHACAHRPMYALLGLSYAFASIFILLPPPSLVNHIHLTSCMFYSLGENTFMVLKDPFVPLLDPCAPILEWCVPS
jgi:hypothetical protein